MSEALQVAIIGGLFMFFGTCLTVWGTIKKTNKDNQIQREKYNNDLKADIATLKVQNEKHTDEIKSEISMLKYRIDEVEEKQDKHNQLIDRTYELEKKSAVHDEELKVANHRISDLERKSA